MITAVCFLLAVASVPLLGGDLVRLGEIRLQRWWAIAAALVLQIAVISVFPDQLGPTASGVLHVFSYLLALVFVWANRHLGGMVVIVAGGLMNLAAIAANGGVMPAQRSALERAGIIADSPTFENSAPVDDARLWFLGDVFAIPSGVPFANVFSIGDVVLVLGGAILVHHVCDTRLARLVTRRGASDRCDEMVDLAAALETSGANETPEAPAASSPPPAHRPVPDVATPTPISPPTPAATAPLAKRAKTSEVDALFAVDHRPQRVR